MDYAPSGDGNQTNDAPGIQSSTTSTMKMLAQVAEPLSGSNPISHTNGNGSSGNENGHSATGYTHAVTAVDKEMEVVKMQQDAPPCPECGALTVRSGACYKCMQCGTSLGCS